MQTCQKKSYDREPPIEKAKASLVTYKRQNDNTEISGNFNDIKWLIWIDKRKALGMDHQSAGASRLQSQSFSAAMAMAEITEISYF